MNTYFCKKTAGPITVDGRFDKPEWEGIEPVSLVDTVTGRPPKQKTLCKLQWDDEFLYAAFYCEDNYVNASLTGYNEKIYDEEVVEIFLDDDCDLKTYIEIEVNPLNALLHYSMLNDLKGSKFAFAKVEKSVITAVCNNRPENVWTAEMAIPLREFVTAPNLPPKPGDKWLMNLYRIDRPADHNDEYTAWQATGKINYHMPEKFGELVFSL